MKPLFLLKTISGLSLRDADEIAEAAARMGFGGLVLPRDGDWELVRGFCRGAGRYGIGVWIRDDADRPSGSFGGEVTSVPGYRSERPEFWGCGLYNPAAAEAFLDCSYTELRRELKGFLGYELKGVVTSVGGPLPERPADFAEVQLRPLWEFCRRLGLELAAETGTALPEAEKYIGPALVFTDLDGLTMAERRKVLYGLLAGGARRLGWDTVRYPDFMEERWCAEVEALLELTEGAVGPVAAELPQGVAAKKFGENILIYNTSAGPVSLRPDMEALGAGYIADLEGGVYLPPEAGRDVTLCEGGCLILLPGREREADSLPAVLGCGAIFGEAVTEAELVPELSGMDENRLPLEPENGRAEFEVRGLGKDAALRLEAENASYITLNGLELSGSNIGGGPVVVGAKELRQGRNTLETDGGETVLYGGFSVEGNAIVSPVRPGPGNVRRQGMARYDGPLIYRAILPEDCGGKYLIPEGSFGCALVKIGRRRLRLSAPPFAAPLFSSDGGKTAEVAVFPPGDRADVPFGISTISIVNIE